jgi:hypothetical protein
MKKRIFLGISLLLIMLPLIVPTSVVNTSASDNPLNTGSAELDAIDAGTKLTYDITTFEYGEGIWDVLDLLLAQTNAPDFDKGLAGTLEGSEFIVYVTATGDITLYKYNYTSGLYYDPITVTAEQIFGFLKLNTDITAYANVSMFSFPDDFLEGNFTLYYDYWPWSDFVDPVLDDPTDIFWMNFNSTFISEFERGFDDAALEYLYGGYYWNPSVWDEPWADWYGDYDISWFGQDKGAYHGYQFGYDAVWHSSLNLAWNDSATALDAYYASYFDGRDDGFAEGQADYLNNKIPDNNPPTLPAPTNLGEWVYERDYQRYWSDFYQMGFRYEADLDNFNFELYKDLYESWNTWFNGYVDGYQNYYWNGRNDGYWDAFNSELYGTNYYPPDYLGGYYDDYDYGYEAGMYDGYDQGYSDGYYSTFVGEEKLNGYHSVLYSAYQEGFAEGSADNLASQPYDETPTLPYPSPANTFEEAANDCYDQQYREGYGNGFLYATLVSSPNSLDWLRSLGPFYNMTLPDVEVSLQGGSLLPTPLMDMTTFTEVDLNLMDEYEFDRGTHDYGVFSSNFMSFMSFDAVDQNWTAFDEIDFALNETEGSPGFNTTWDVADDSFVFEVHINATEPGIAADIYMGYDTLTGKLLNISASLDFYSQTDIWANIVLKLNEGKTETWTPQLPSAYGDPNSWTYSIDNFVFYYDLPPTVPTDFADGVAEFKADGISTIGNPLLGVDMKSYDGIWAIADYTFYDPTNTSELPNTEEYRYPMIFPAGHQILPDWDFYDGFATTVSSVFGHADYLVDAATALSGKNTNVNIVNIAFNPVIGSYHHVATGLDVMYYYVSLEADVDMTFSMLNGDYVWETTTVDGTIDAFLWVGIDYITGVVLGAGVKTSFDFELTAVPDYGNNGAIAAYLEVTVGVDFRAIPHIDTLIGTLPTVFEFSLLPLLSIIGLAGMVSAVIFFKKK